MDKEYSFDRTIEGTKYSFSTGKFANQSSAAVSAQAGETIILSVVTMSKEIKEDIDFFPLTVDYMERMYAAGKIPGGFFKRGGRSTDYEILKSRLIDRSVRPLFPKYMRNDVQIICYVLSSDGNNQPDILAINATSLALCISEIPFNGPVSAVRIGLVDNKFVANTPFSEDDNSLLDLVIAETKKSVVMVEAGCLQLPEEVMLDAFSYATKINNEFTDFQNEIIRSIPVKEKIIINEPVIDEDIKSSVDIYLKDKIDNVLFNPVKEQRENAVDNLKNDLLAELEDKFPEQNDKIEIAFEKYVSAYVRQKIVLEDMRPDGRSTDEIRPISIEVGLLPRVHGSGMFKRGTDSSLNSCYSWSKR